MSIDRRSLLIGSPSAPCIDRTRFLPMPVATFRPESRYNPRL
jgi:hypothetical protein